MVLHLPSHPVEDPLRPPGAHAFLRECFCVSVCVTLCFTDLGLKVLWVGCGVHDLEVEVVLVRVYGSGFGVWGLGFRVWGVGCGVCGSKKGVLGGGRWGVGLGSRVGGVGCGVSGCGV